MKKNKISAAPSIRRLPSYLHIIKQVRDKGGDSISGTVIANELNLEPIQVRKDLAITGIVGKPKCGYPVAALIAAIERFLGWDIKRPAVLVGAGNLATALAGYSEFKFNGLDFLAAFDINPAVIGSDIRGVPVYPLSDLPEIVRKTGAEIAVLTVPSERAQETADICLSNNIRAIWNFTRIKIKVPEDVALQCEDLTSGFALLSMKMNARRASG
jgi:redox-sensing transcriptional repressor